MTIKREIREAPDSQRALADLPLPTGADVVKYDSGLRQRRQHHDSEKALANALRNLYH